MRHDPKSPPVVALTVLAAGLLLSGCSDTSMPTLAASVRSSTASGATAVPSKYAPEEFVGRWGFTSYHREQDRARTEAAARGQCRSPYVIARGPTAAS